VRVDGDRVTTAFRVRYAETDQMGVAYYANYLVWFEVMRGDFMRAVGFPYKDLERQGVFLPITEATIRYLRPVRYDDAIEVSARITGLKSRAVTFAYEVHRDRQLIATGSTTHVPVNAEGRPVQVPRELADHLGGMVRATDAG
jgi:acyl-CoA thioester hydrolase